MDVIYRISSSVSDAWVAWVLLLLLLLLALNRFFVADIALVVRGLYSRSERSYSDMSWQAQSLALIYRVDLMAMIVYLCLYSMQGCSGVEFLKILGISICVLGVQYALVWFVGKVFLTDRQLDSALDFRARIYNSVGALSFPVLLLLRICESLEVIVIVSWALLGLSVVLLLWKSIQMFCRKWLSVCYILLYMAILEVLPLLLIFDLIKYL